MKYLANGFSLSMLDRLNRYLLIAEPVTIAGVPTDAQSIIGHEGTASILSRMLKRDIPMNRKAIELLDGDILFVVSLFRDGKPFRPPVGSDLPEEELEELSLRFSKVEVKLSPKWTDSPPT